MEPRKTLKDAITEESFKMVNKTEIRTENSANESLCSSRDIILITILLYCHGISYFKES